MDRRRFLAGAVMASILGGESARAAPALRTQVDEEDLFARHGADLILRYRQRLVADPMGKNPLLTTNGYLHPVAAPNGAVVTNHFAPDHPHQRGVFSAWTKTELAIDGETLHPDFWNIHLGTGRVRSVSVAPVSGGFRAELVSEARGRDRWEPVLDETWEVRFPAAHLPADPAAQSAAHIFDLISRQKPRRPIQLLKYHYGGMAVRGSGAWAKGSDLSVLTSEGKDRAGADQARARWIDMSGTVDGKQAGIALLEHPANLHAPNGIRMHPDMPYCVFALPQSGPVTLEPGREYVFRYRIVAHNGRANSAALDRLWREFAAAS